MIRALVLMPLLFLAACGSRSDDVGGVSPEEDRMLNDAASALDANYMAAPANDADANMTGTGNTQ